MRPPPYAYQRRWDAYPMLKRVGSIYIRGPATPGFCPGFARPGFLGVGDLMGRGGEHGRIRAHLWDAMCDRVLTSAQLTTCRTVVTTYNQSRDHGEQRLGSLLRSLNLLTVPLGAVGGRRSGRPRALRAFHCSLRNLSQGKGATMHACRDPVPRNSTSPRQGGWSGSPDRVTL